MPFFIASESLHSSHKLINMLDLISDTVTKPSAEMLKAMLDAPVGDDVFGSDPTVNTLQAMAAERFGHESALFCPSGTMTNQIAIKAHTQALDEVWCDEMSHIYQYEVGGYAFHSGVALRMTKTPKGIIQVDDLKSLEHPNQDWLPSPSLVVLENTCNKGGGTCYNLETMQEIHSYCQEQGLSLHLDGARLFNAIVAKGYTEQEIGNCFDSISICLSKGLGAPVGSLLIGSKAFIDHSRRIRKVMGGGMRQVGILAAACIFALEHNIDLLLEDHEKANVLNEILNDCDAVKKVREVETNIVLFDLYENGSTAHAYCKSLAQEGISAAAFGKYTIRLVTHMDVHMKDIRKAADKIKSILS